MPNLTHLRAEQRVRASAEERRVRVAWERASRMRRLMRTVYGAEWDAYVDGNERKAKQARRS